MADDQKQPLFASIEDRMLGRTSTMYGETLPEAVIRWNTRIAAQGLSPTSEKAAR